MKCSVIFGLACFLAFPFDDASQRSKFVFLANSAELEGIWTVENNVGHSAMGLPRRFRRVRAGRKATGFTGDANKLDVGSIGRILLDRHPRKRLVLCSWMVEVWA